MLTRTAVLLRLPSQIRAAIVSAAFKAPRPWPHSFRTYTDGVPFGAQQGWKKEAAEKDIGTDASHRGERLEAPALDAVFPVLDASNWGTVIANDPDNTSLRELLEAVNLKSLLASPPDRPLACLTLLVTPKFARDAVDVETIARHSSELLGIPPERLHLTVAVVDRLPVPDGSGASGEGLAYLEMAEGDHDDGSEHALSPFAQKSGSLNFLFHDPQPVHNPRTLQTTQYDYKYQLPLANTIFQNGLPSTLHRCTLQPENTSEHVGGAGIKRLESATIVLPQLSSKVIMRMGTPLIPLTRPRMVTASMGNIIRQLSASKPRTDALDTGTLGGTESVSTAASEELEAAVQAYFRALDIPPQPVAVWALIMPVLPPEQLAEIGRSAHINLLKTSPKKIEEEWVQPRDRLISIALSSLLRRGGRLCQVLSGGGGWGKKAGLLSLDPDSEYSTRTLREDGGWEFDFKDDSEAGVAKQQRDALGEIVKEGESVIFLIAPSDSEAVSAASLASKREWKGSFTFGCIPSSIDAVPAAASIPASDGKPNIDVYENHFGLLSEGGMALTITCNGSELRTRTKLDAPFTRVTIGAAKPIEPTLSQGSTDGGRKESVTTTPGEGKQPSQDPKRSVEPAAAARRKTKSSRQFRDAYPTTSRFIKESSQDRRGNVESSAPLVRRVLAKNVLREDVSTGALKNAGPAVGGEQWNQQRRAPADGTASEIYSRPESHEFSGERIVSQGEFAHQQAKMDRAFSATEDEDEAPYSIPRGSHASVLGAVGSITRTGAAVGNRHVPRSGSRSFSTGSTLRQQRKPTGPEDFMDHVNHTPESRRRNIGDPPTHKTGLAINADHNDSSLLEKSAQGRPNVPSGDYNGPKNRILSRPKIRIHFSRKDDEHDTWNKHINVAMVSGQPSVSSRAEPDDLEQRKTDAARSVKASTKAGLPSARQSKVDNPLASKDEPQYIIRKSDSTLGAMRKEATATERLFHPTISPPDNVVRTHYGIHHPGPVPPPPERLIRAQRFDRHGRFSYHEIEQVKVPDVQPKFFGRKHVVYTGGQEFPVRKWEHATPDASRRPLSVPYWGGERQKSVDELLGARPKDLISDARSAERGEDMVFTIVSDENVELEEISVLKAVMAESMTWPRAGSQRTRNAVSTARRAPKRSHFERMGKIPPPAPPKSSNTASTLSSPSQSTPEKQLAPTEMPHLRAIPLKPVKLATAPADTSGGSSGDGAMQHLPPHGKVSDSPAPVTRRAWRIRTRARPTIRGAAFRWTVRHASFRSTFRRVSFGSTVRRVSFGSTVRRVSFEADPKNSAGIRYVGGVRGQRELINIHPRLSAFRGGSTAKATRPRIISRRFEQRLLRRVAVARLRILRFRTQDTPEAASRLAKDALRERRRERALARHARWEDLPSPMRPDDDDCGLEVDSYRRSAYSRLRDVERQRQGRNKLTASVMELARSYRM